MRLPDGCSWLLTGEFSEGGGESKACVFCVVRGSERLKRRIIAARISLARAFRWGNFFIVYLLWWKLLSVFCI